MFHYSAQPCISQISLIEVETLISTVAEVMQPADGRAKIQAKLFNIEAQKLSKCLRHLVLKLERASESSGDPVKTQITGPQT